MSKYKSIFLTAIMIMKRIILTNLPQSVTPAQVKAIICSDVKNC